MAELGHDVIGVDIDPGKVAKLSAGEIPFYEPDLAEMLQANWLMWQEAVKASLE